MMSLEFLLTNLLTSAGGRINAYDGGEPVESKALLPNLSLQEQNDKVIGMNRQPSNSATVKKKKPKIQVSCVKTISYVNRVKANQDETRIKNTDMMHGDI